MSTHRVVGALLLIVGAVVFVAAEACAAAGWTDPSYNYRFDFISDLGNPVPHDLVFGHTVNSPWYFAMNFGFVSQGILFGAATVLLYRAFPGRPRFVVLVCGMLHGIGMVIAGVFNQQSVNGVEMAIHWLGAYGIVFGPVAVALVGVLGGQAGAPAWYRAVSVVLGLGGILSGLALVSIPALQTVIGGGAMERIAMYGLFAWQLITGAFVLLDARLQLSSWAPRKSISNASPRPWTTSRSRTSSPSATTIVRTP
jgi:hypothetical protein